ncbi:MFS transporter [Chelatococcus reniformis]|uniref:MFS transporter n=1 Tax=Chelatococcus reniformis TaxID=1494448 RepID=A0A916XAK5_9HYPH|nr:MFS transporter [Chelatococcus reniformis]GGC59842.1 MFS transporter [Chelatococcus reniformis]
MTTRAAQPGAWGIVALLFLFMLINFVDKAIIGLAGVPIMRDLELTPSQFGLVGSSFFFLFSISAIVTGFLVNRIQARWALLVMGLVWALTQFPMLGQIGFAGLIACRIVLGAGEGPAYPVALHAAYKWFPNERRVLPTAVIAQGASIGVMVALPLLNWVIVNHSWRWAFGLLGVLGLAWTLAWFMWGREGTLVDEPAAGSQSSGATIPYARLLTTPSVLACWCAYFGAYWALSIGIAWQTPYLISGLGFSQHQVGWIAALPWGLSVVTVIFLGWLSQRLMLKGVSSRVARGLLGGVCVATGGVVLTIMPALPTVGLKIAATVVGGALPAVIYVLSHAVVSELTPTSQRGAMLAIGNAAGTMAGVLAPAVMGFMIQDAATPLDGFNRGFVTCGIIMMICGLIGMVFIRPERDRARLAARPTTTAAPAPAPGE